MRTKYSEEVKAAVMAALLGGQAMCEVAKAYSIPEGTLKAWGARARKPKRVREVAEVSAVAPEKRIVIGDLLIAYLRANLKTLDAQTVIFSDVEWLKKQSASELAVLHGVMTDKAVRLLEALGASEIAA